MEAAGAFQTNIDTILSDYESIDSEDSDDFNLEETMKSLMNTDSKFSGYSFYQRRIRTKHAPPQHKLWLPGKSSEQSSFNCICSKRFTIVEDKNDRNFSCYYYPRKKV